MRVPVFKSLIAAAVAVLCLGVFGAHGASADQMLTFTIVNDSGNTANELIVHMLAPPGSVTTSASGCGVPTIDYIDFSTYGPAIIEWPSPCVSPGEEVSIAFSYSCPCPSQPFTTYTWLYPTPAPVGGSITLRVSSGGDSLASVFGAAATLFGILAAAFVIARKRSVA